jgi:hypothetical protein
MTTTAVVGVSVAVTAVNNNIIAYFVSTNFLIGSQVYLLY